jgi:hypothetical protein
MRENPTMKRNTVHTHPGVGRNTASSRRTGFGLSCLLVVALGLSVSPTAEAKLYLTRDEALSQAFGDSATIVTRTAYLTDSQVESIAGLAAAPFDARRITYYEALDPGPEEMPDRLLGHAYIETHRVRTLSETVMVVVGIDGRVARVDVLAFHEPEDYLAPSRWIEALAGRELTPTLAPARDLPNLAGSTLTARALAAAVRRALAAHQIIHATSTSTAAE